MTSTPAFPHARRIPSSPPPEGPSGAGIAAGLRRMALVIACAPMLTFACLYHWYMGAMYVAPVAAVGGWGWWSTKRMSNHQDTPQA